MAEVDWIKLLALEQAARAIRSSRRADNCSDNTTELARAGGAVAARSLGFFAEVNWLRRRQHPDRTRRPAFKARITAATVFVSAPRPTRTVIPSLSTSMTHET